MLSITDIQLTWLFNLLDFYFVSIFDAFEFETIVATKLSSWTASLRDPGIELKSLWN